MRRIAVYGKGGIGKSTISANLSAAFSLLGRSVLQIGCDPRHDSTRFLLRGRRLTTVLEYMRVTKPQDYRLQDILAEGFHGNGCVEAGGPKPGVGCAGRGIISTFELLDQFHLRERYEITIYDVLGDVVCGGFAVPIRREYADTILIVTSGEFMALYAANNILRGIANYDGEKKRIAGLVFNRRNVEGEAERVRRFAEAVDLPVFMTVPRSDAFTRSARANMTAVEQGEDAEIAGLFRKTAQRLLEDIPLYGASPLTDEELEETILGKAEPVLNPLPEQSRNSLYSKENGRSAADASAKSQENASAKKQENASAETGDDNDLAAGRRYLSKNLVPGAALQGCAFNGALTVTAQVRDAVTLAHSPKNCVFIAYQGISSGGRRALYERGASLPSALLPNISCTEMGEPEIVFGGMEKLKEKIEECKKDDPGAVIVVSSCPAGIIGDDIDQVRALEMNSSPEESSARSDNTAPGESSARPDNSAPEDRAVPVITIRADGNMAGDFMQGNLMAHILLAEQLCRKEVEKAPMTVNILGEKAAVTNTEDNFRTVRDYLSALGVRVNCRFVCNTTADEIRNFKAASYSLMAYGDYTTRTIADFFQREMGQEICSRAFPVGFDETREWLQEITDHFGGDTKELADKLCEDEEKNYLRETEVLRPLLSGKKLMIMTYNHELDWILRTALDTGMEIVKIGVMDYSQDEGFRTRLKESLPVVNGYDGTELEADIRKFSPDVLLTNYVINTAYPVPVADTIPFCPDAGFRSGISMVRRWAGLLRLNLKGGWMQDEALFRKYYTR